MSRIPISWLVGSQYTSRPPIRRLWHERRVRVVAFGDSRVMVACNRDRMKSHAIFFFRDDRGMGGLRAARSNRETSTSYIGFGLGLG